ncbi:hypothetical protein GGQ74_002074 [Desulfobaculum xiamenense]|uniref:SIMPL domain-containing protein n=1 Tax=Desulfobaculum xiamenense TaxID=995050 RepID=A0A846QJT3_9BACT|nr:SIMPL domain-containing protein [Desulfobaculum xiamenense]NJB68401.1 hypothetical protein [Desulfobaculum xiamenense]
MNHSRSAALILGATIAIGLAMAGYFLSDGLVRLKAAERYVTVKGLAECEVQADLAIWPIVFTASANSLPKLQEELDAADATVTAFLAKRGFTAEEIGRSVPQITDYQAQGYVSDRPPLARYSARATLTVHTPKVAEVKKAMAESGQLVTAGVALAQDYGSQPEFSFTGLNAIKPKMIADATQNARDAASQFAKDSQSKVGSIRRATQGLFTITNRDANTPEIKNVRVVTTVDYFLED